MGKQENNKFKGKRHASFIESFSDFWHVIDYTVVGKSEDAPSMWLIHLIVKDIDANKVYFATEYGTFHKNEWRTQHFNYFKLNTIDTLPIFNMDTIKVLYG